MRDPIQALEQYRQRGGSLNDKRLEKSLFDQLVRLEMTIDSVGPTPLRHELSEKLVQMRAAIWAFDQSQSDWR